MSDQIQKENENIDSALELGIIKCLHDSKRLSEFPHVTKNGEWLTSEHGRWTAGFFVGMIWMSGMVKDDANIYKTAESWAKRLESRSFDCSTHDMGFLFEPSMVRGFNITGNKYFRDNAVQAAKSLASRFHRKGLYIPAWSPEEDLSYLGLAIVDTIMNLPILIWAGRMAGDQDLCKIGNLCAETIQAQHIRPNGSTYHTVDHDDETGAISSKGTHQGADNESCWTRGQAWALHGFAKISIMTGSKEFLTTALQLADYFLNRLGNNILPPWDFDRSGEGQPRDSAAAAIAASGLLELSKVSGDITYADQGRRIVLGLIDSCVDFEHPDRPGLLMHGTVDYPRRSGVDESIMYGDHYFMEALIKLRYPQLWGSLSCVLDS